LSDGATTPCIGTRKRKPKQQIKRAYWPDLTREDINHEMIMGMNMQAMVATWISPNK
jgi:hypothetical protein